MLNVSFIQKEEFSNKSTNVFIVRNEQDLSRMLHETTPYAESALSAITRDKSFDYSTGSYTVLNGEYGILIIISIKESTEDLEIEAQRIIACKICDLLNQMKQDSATIYYYDYTLDDHTDPAISKANKHSRYNAISNIILHIKLRNYQFIQLFHNKLKEKQNTLTNIKVNTTNAKETELVFNTMYDPVYQGITLTRDLVNAPANIIYPASFAKKCTELEAVGLSVRIIEKTEMIKMGMGAMLGVAQGSQYDPKLVIIEWTGNSDNADKTNIAFVGKGVTFDSGGINIKPSNGISDMKYDMAGAAVVTGLMSTLARRKSKVNAIGVLGLVENMPSATAQRPGDVVISMSKQTIEVDNTDAEGRLVLADALTYTQKHYNPDAIIDLATLTGAVVVALGDIHAGLFTNNNDIANQLAMSSENTGELIWQLPMHKQYDKQINSKIADIKNTGQGRGAGSITAAQFLARFVDEGRAWAHLDIAGVSWSDKADAVNSKGATGFGVALLNNWVATNYDK